MAAVTVNRSILRLYVAGMLPMEVFHNYSSIKDFNIDIYFTHLE